MKTVGITHIGNIRTTNEDTLLIECEKAPRYMLVADGMGGHAAGEVASKTAAMAIKRYITALDCAALSDEQILDAVRYANGRLLADMKKNGQLKGMGTTLTFAYAEGGRLTIAQVGDSSAFLYDGGAVVKLTRDHTYVQHLLDSGVIEKGAEQDYPFKNIITRAIGMKKLEVDLYHVDWKEGDLLALCSDGLTSYADDALLRETLAGVAAGVSIEDMAQSLVDHALNAGGKDNISLIIAQNTPEEGASE